jgi:prepilin-type N-terminal cleavage/methylation domain-containing protein
MTRTRQAGFVLPELIVAMTVGLILLSATLLTFERFVHHSNENDKRNDTAELARRSLDIEARQLRNLAKRVNNADVIARMNPYDFVFQTSDPAKTWVRYCLDTSQGTSNGRVFEQVESGDVPGAGTACPATSGWKRSIVVADNIVNQSGGRTAPMFTYRCVDGTTACTSSIATSDRLIGVNAQLLVDTTPAGPPEELQVNSGVYLRNETIVDMTPGTGAQELRLVSGVYLRNQNQAPSAVFSAPPVSGSARTVQFNASSSTDFEGRTLTFYWFLGNMPTTIRCDQPKEAVTNSVVSMWGGSFIGTGVVLRYTWSGTTPAAGTQQTVGLVACDPGDRYGYVTKSVPIPS